MDTGYELGGDERLVKSGPNGLSELKPKVSILVLRWPTTGKSSKVASWSPQTDHFKTPANIGLQEGAKKT